MNTRHAAEDVQIHARVLDNIDRAVVAIDRAGRIALFNPAAQAYTGLSERQSLGRKFEELFAGQEKILALIRSAMAVGRSISDDENIHCCVRQRRRCRSASRFHPSTPTAANRRGWC